MVGAECLLEKYRHQLWLYTSSPSLEMSSWALGVTSLRSRVGGGLLVSLPQRAQVSFAGQSAPKEPYPGKEEG